MEFDPVEIEATKPSAEQSKEEFLDKVASTGETVTRSMRVENPAKWFPDTPNLYKLLIELKDESGEVIEAAVQRIGFREVYKVNINDCLLYTSSWTVSLWKPPGEQQRHLISDPPRKKDYFQFFFDRLPCLSPSLRVTMSMKGEERTCGLPSAVLYRRMWIMDHTGPMACKWGRCV